MPLDVNIRQQFLSLTESEIRGEMAAALGRIGAMLRKLLCDLEAMQNEIENASGEDKKKAVAEFNAARREAKLYYWYLIVQREAVGLRSHTDVAELFRIPSRI